jgi:hypothetical protein
VNTSLQEERRRNLASRGSSAAGKRFRTPEMLLIPQTPDRQTSSTSLWLSVHDGRETPPSRDSRVSRYNSYNTTILGAHDQQHQQHGVNQQSLRQHATASASLPSNTEDTKSLVVQKLQTHTEAELTPLLARKTSVRFQGHDDSTEHAVGEMGSSSYACLGTSYLMIYMIANAHIPCTLVLLGKHKASFLSNTKMSLSRRCCGIKRTV